MRIRLRGGLVAVLAAAAVVGVPAQAAAAAGCEWRAAQLTLPPDVLSGSVSAAAGDGWFAGGGGPREGGFTRVLRWHGEGEPKDLGLPPGASVDVKGVSAAGTVVGMTMDEQFRVRAAQNRDGTWYPLVTLGTKSSALDINTAGDVVGTDVGPNQDDHRLVVWPAENPETPKYLPLPADAIPGIPTPTIDEDGTVAATYATPTAVGYRPYAWLWHPGATEPTKLGLFTESAWSEAIAIRNGHIVGYTLDEDGYRTGVEWDTTGALVRKFPGLPTAVNTEGFAVGRDHQRKWVVWTPAETTEPVQLPADQAQLWPTSFNDNAVGGTLYDNNGNATPTAWTRHC